MKNLDFSKSKIQLGSQNRHLTKLLFIFKHYHNLLKINDNSIKHLNFDNKTKQACIDFTNSIIEMDENQIKSYVENNVPTNKLTFFIDIVYCGLKLMCEKNGHDTSFIKVNIETAYELNETQIDQIIEAIYNKEQKQCYANLIINPKIIGGLCVSYNTMVYDDTYIAKLKKMKQNIIKEINQDEQKSN